MTSAYILVLAILILGAFIAVLGDRIGTKVGKARLRLFNLRPKQTAIVVTFLTGVIIAASTLIILFSFSKSLRQGVFQLDEILQKRRHVQADLDRVTKQKKQVEVDLEKSKIEQEKVKNDFIKTQLQLANITKQTQNLDQEVKKIVEEKKQLLQQREILIQESEQLQEKVRKRDLELNFKQDEISQRDKFLRQQKNKLQEIEKKQKNLQLEINNRDEKITKLDDILKTKDDAIKKREQDLINLEKELIYVQKQVEILAEYYQNYQDLRQNPIALIKGQVLAAGVIKVTENKEELNASIDNLLWEANKQAIQALGFANSNQKIVQISPNQVQQIEEELSKKNTYFVRIISAGNYVEKERIVRVFTDINENKLIYNQEQIIANISLDIDDIKSEELQERLDFLISVTQFRARRAGVLGNIIIADGKIVSLVNFLQQLQEYQESIKEVRAIATDKTYTAGILQITLVVIGKDGEEMLRL